MPRHIKGKIIGLKNCKSGPEMAQQLRVNNASAEAQVWFPVAISGCLQPPIRPVLRGGPIPLVSIGTALTCTYPHTYTHMPFLKGM